MTEKNYYVIDTSSLIELNRRYPIDVFPTLWKNMENLIKKGFLTSHKEVLKEILVKDDILARWAKRQKKLFKSLTEKQVGILKKILKKYPSLARSGNESVAADPFVIALAVETITDPQQSIYSTKKGQIVVTEERLRGNRVKIPFVCKAYGIKCMNIIEMCRKEGWKF